MEAPPVNHFDFYLRFAKPLVLNLAEPNERVLAAAWLQKLRNPDSGDEQLRTDYLKLLLFVLQRKRLAGLFTQNPGQYETLEQFPEQYKLKDVAKALIAAEEEERLKRAKGPGGASGDFPPYTTEYSADLLEYSAAQDIPNFGVHVYYAISTDPLPLWDNANKGIFPRTLSSGKIDVVAAASASTSVASTLSEIGGGKRARARSRSRSRSMSRSRSRSRSPKRRRSPKGGRPPSPPLGSGPPEEEWSPPTWGTNLIQVSDPPENLFAAELMDGGGDLLLDESFKSYEEPPSARFSDYESPDGFRLTRPPAITLKPTRLSFADDDFGALQYEAPSPPAAPPDEDLERIQRLTALFEREDREAAAAAAAAAAAPKPRSPAALAVPASKKVVKKTSSTRRMIKTTAKPPAKPAPKAAPPRAAPMRAAPPRAAPPRAAPPKKAPPKAVPKVAKGAAKPKVVKKTSKTTVKKTSTGEVAAPTVVEQTETTVITVEKPPQPPAPKKKRMLQLPHVLTKLDQMKWPELPSTTTAGVLPVSEMDELRKLGLTEEDLQDINLDDLDLKLDDISDQEIDYEDVFEEEKKDNISQELEEYDKLIRQLEEEYAEDIAMFADNSLSELKISRSPERSPRTPERSPRTPQRSPRTPQGSPRTPQRSPTTPHRSPTPPRRTPTPPRRSPTPQRREPSPAARAPTPVMRQATPPRRSPSPAARAFSPPCQPCGGAQAADMAGYFPQFPPEGMYLPGPPPPIQLEVRPATEPADFSELQFQPSGFRDDQDLSWDTEGAVGYGTVCGNVWDSPPSPQRSPQMGARPQRGMSPPRERPPMERPQFPPMSPSKGAIKKVITQKTTKKKKGKTVEVTESTTTIEPEPAPAPCSRVSPPGAPIPPPCSSIPAPSSRIPPPGSSIPAPGSRIPPPRSRIPPPGSRIPPPGSRIPPPCSSGPCSQPSASASGIPRTASRLPQPGSRLPQPGTRIKKTTSKTTKIVKPAAEPPPPSPPKRSPRPPKAPSPQEVLADLAKMGVNPEDVDQLNVKVEELRIGDVPEGESEGTEGPTTDEGSDTDFERLDAALVEEGKRIDELDHRLAALEGQESAKVQPPPGVPLDALALAQRQYQQLLTPVPPTIRSGTPAAQEIIKEARAELEPVEALYETQARPDLAVARTGSAGVLAVRGDWSEADIEPEEPEEFVVTLPPRVPPDPKQEFAEVLKDLDSSPAMGGLPVTTPKRSQSPRRLGGPATSPHGSSQTTALDLSTRKRSTPPRLTYTTDQLQQIAQDQYSALADTPPSVEPGTTEIVSQTVEQMITTEGPGGLYTPRRRAPSARSPTPSPFRRLTPPPRTPSPPSPFYYSEGGEDLDMGRIIAETEEYEQLDEEVPFEVMLRGHEIPEEFKHPARPESTPYMMVGPTRGKLVVLPQRRFAQGLGAFSPIEEERPHEAYQLTQREEREIEHYIRPAMHETFRRLSRLVHDVEQPSEFKVPTPPTSPEYRPPIVQEDVGAIDQEAGILAASPPSSPVARTELVMPTFEDVEVEEEVWEEFNEPLQVQDEGLDLTQELLPPEYYYSPKKKTPPPPKPTWDPFAVEVYCASPAAYTKSIPKSSRKPRVSPVKEEFLPDEGPPQFETPSRAPSPSPAGSPPRPGAPVTKRSSRRKVVKRTIDFSQAEPESGQEVPQARPDLEGRPLGFPDDLMGTEYPLPHYPQPGTGISPPAQAGPISPEWEEGYWSPELKPQVTVPGWTTPEKYKTPRPRAPTAEDVPLVVRERVDWLRGMQQPAELVSPTVQSGLASPIGTEGPGFLFEEEVVEETVVTPPAAPETWPSPPPPSPPAEVQRQIQQAQERAADQYACLCSPPEEAAIRTPPRRPPVQQPRSLWEEDVPELMPPGSPPSPMSTADAMQEMLNTLMAGNYTVPEHRRRIEVCGYGARKPRVVIRHSEDSGLPDVREAREPRDKYEYWPGPYRPPPRPQAAAPPRPQTGAIPRPRTGGIPRPQTGGIPRPKTAGPSQSKTGAVARPKTAGPPQSKTGAVPRPKTAGPSKSKTGFLPRVATLASKTSQTSKEPEKKPSVTKVVQKRIKKVTSKETKKTGKKAPAAPAAGPCPAPAPCQAEAAAAPAAPEPVASQEIVVEEVEIIEERPRITSPSWPVFEMEPMPVTPFPRIQTGAPPPRRAPTPPRAATPPRTPPRASMSPRTPTPPRQLSPPLPDTLPPAMAPRVDLPGWKTPPRREKPFIPQPYTLPMGGTDAWDMSPPQLYGAAEGEEPYPLDDGFIMEHEESVISIISASPEYPGSPEQYIPPYDYESPTRERVPSPMLGFTPPSTPPDVDPRLKKQLQSHEYTMNFRRDNRPYTRRMVRTGERGNYDMGQRLPYPDMEDVMEETEPSSQEEYGDSTFESFETVPSPFLGYTPPSSPPDIDPRLQRYLQMHEYTLNWERDDRPYQSPMARAGSRSLYDMSQRLTEPDMEVIEETEQSFEEDYGDATFESVPSPFLGYTPPSSPPDVDPRLQRDLQRHEYTLNWERDDRPYQSPVARVGHKKYYDMSQRLTHPDMEVIEEAEQSSGDEFGDSTLGSVPSPFLGYTPPTSPPGVDPRLQRNLQQHEYTLRWERDDRPYKDPLVRAGDRSYYDMSQRLTFPDMDIIEEREQSTQEEYGDSSFGSVPSPFLGYTPPATPPGVDPRLQRDLNRHQYTVNFDRDDRPYQNPFARAGELNYYDMSQRLSYPDMEIIDELEEEEEEISYPAETAMRSASPQRPPSRSPSPQPRTPSPSPQPRTPSPPCCGTPPAMKTPSPEQPKIGKFVTPAPGPSWQTPEPLQRRPDYSSPEQGKPSCGGSCG